MKRVARIISAVACLLFVLFVSLTIFVRFYGKEFIEQRASLMLRRPVVIDKVSLSFPMVLNIQGINVEGLLWVKEARVRCDVTTFMGKSFYMSEVKFVDPILTVHRSQDNQIIWAEHYDDGTHGAAILIQVASFNHNGSESARMVKAAIRSLIVENGQIYFPSHSSIEESEVSFHNVRLKAKNVPLSGQSLDAHFEFSGTVIGDNIPFASDHLKGSGWINWPERNMDAVFKVVNPQGKIDVEVNLNSKKNDMMVRGHVNTRRMNFKSEDPTNGSVDRLLLDAVESAGMEINLDFSFPMKMDRWELRNIDFSGSLNASNDEKAALKKP